MSQTLTIENFDDATLLIVDDDDALRVRLGRAMASRGFRPVLAGGVEDAKRVAAETSPAFAVVDLRLSDGSGIDVVNAIHDAREDARVIMFSGYGNIPSAVAAVKAGAVDYLPKPVDADDIEKALLAADGELAAPPENKMPPDVIRLQHIMRVYKDNAGNVSESARRLGMHRRTLQRILAKQGEEFEAVLNGAPADAAGSSEERGDATSFGDAANDDAGI
ncbi:MAG: response regulator [Pseudomonadota bacterium]